LIKIRDFLHEEGYKAQIFEDTIVNSAASGFRFQIQPYRDSIQFRCFIATNSDENINEIFTNKINGLYRFIKTYIDNDGDIVVESDWWFDLEKSDCGNIFSNAIGLWDLGLSTIARQLRQARKGEIDEEPSED